MSRSDWTRSAPVLGAALLVVGLAAGALLPKLATLGRLSAKRIAGVQFTSGVPGGGRASADPARARPA